MKIYPPLMVLAGIITQLLIGYIAPVEPLLSATWQYIGIALMVLGFATILLAARSFRKHETTIIPDGQPSTLMEGGLFAYSRNPIYVAMAVLLSRLGPCHWTYLGFDCRALIRAAGAANLDCQRRRKSRSRVRSDLPQL